MTRPVIRCAIYTRKSSDEGLGQEFNSLDAQHEACAAYIASQRHEGWKQVSQRYDDGGISGGTLERPALQRLLGDIDADRIGMVVVYKIDRLTRSLADFAKLVERLEAAGCSFVSVTQAFNTSSSMGRLTLNVLLSFAQFEREVTAERIRDKIAGSKRKGMWMGGMVPLGYDRHPDPLQRMLVPNPAEARIVQQIFDLYERHGCLRLVEQEVEAQGVRSKLRHFASGRTSGGSRLSRGQIQYLLANPVYIGRTRHKEKTWPGLHKPIIAQEQWERVQARLQRAAARPRRQRAGEASEDNRGNPAPPGATIDRALLVGKLRDESGDRLTPSHTTRRGKRLRYYVSNRLLQGRKDPTGWRLPAPALEEAVIRALTDHLQESAACLAILAEPDAQTAETVRAAAAVLVGRLRSGDRQVLQAILLSGRVSRESLVLQLDPTGLGAALAVEEAQLAPSLLQIEAPFALRRRGVETKLVAGRPAAGPDPTLRRMLGKAHRWCEDLRQGQQLADIARREGHTESYLRTRAQLAFLSPSIQAAIVAGTQPPELSLAEILRRGVPLDWAEQERLLGFAG